MLPGIKGAVIVRFRKRKRRRTKEIRPILALLAAAATVGYFLPEVMERSPLSGDLQVATTSTAGTIVGRASVIDGDTIEIRGERIRLNGIDAPEGSQLCEDGSGRNYRCGARSADALSVWLAASSPTNCKFIERDQYGRFVGDCSRADGVNVQRWMVRNGHAMDWPRYSNSAYSGEQSAAKAEKIGIWQGAFQQPWEWRAAQRGQSETSTIVTMMPSGASTAVAAERACDIKGNISNRGERIYHVPSQKWYSRTKISPSKGERWFCSEQEARAAGWRRSRQ